MTLWVENSKLAIYVTLRFGNAKARRNRLRSNRYRMRLNRGYSGSLNFHWFARLAGVLAGFTILSALTRLEALTCRGAHTNRRPTKKSLEQP